MIIGTKNHKMNRRFLKQKTNCIALLVMLAVFLFTPITVFAGYEDLWDQEYPPSTRQKPLVYDDADLLTPEEEQELLNKLEDVSRRHRCNVLVVTTDDYYGDIEEFADNYYYYNGFGADYDDNGVTFMLCMADRSYAFATSGTGISAFTDYGQDECFAKMRDDLADNDYFSALMTYGEVADNYLQMYEDGTAYDVGVSMPKTREDLIAGLFACIGIGLFGALIPIVIMGLSLNNVHMNASASGYQSKKGINMSLHTDSFRTQTLSKRPIPQESSSGSSGGSTVHTSSSGHSHGGSHGHF
jgi:uncharacterized protein